MDATPNYNNKYPAFFISALIVISAYLISFSSQLLFQISAEFLRVIIGVAIFIVTWNSRRFLDNHYFVFLGIAYLFVAGLDFIHILQLPGLEIIPFATPNTPAQLWLAARFLGATALVLAPFYIRQRLRTEFIFPAYAFVFFFILLAIFQRGIFPPVFAAGQGMTLSGIIGEIIICLMFLAGLALLVKNRTSFDQGVWRMLSVSIVFQILAEIHMSLSIAPDDLQYTTSLLLRLTAFLIMYRAIVVFSLKKPYGLLFHNLKKSEDRFRFALKNSPLVVFNQDKNLRYTWIYNPAMPSIEKEVLGKTDYDIFAPEDAKKLAEIKQKVISTGIGERKEITISENGTTLHYDLTVEPIWGEKKEIIGITCSSADITARKQTENALLESEHKYNIVADNTSDWEFWLGPDKKFIYTSPSCEKITGYKAGNFYSNPDLHTRIIHPEDRGRYEKHLKNFTANEETDFLEFRITKADGTACWIAHVCQPIFSPGGKFLGRRGNNRDITKRKQAEEALQTAYKSLEKRVRERTADLTKANEKLTQYREHLEQLVKERTQELSSANEKLKAEIAERQKAEKTIRFHSTILESIKESAIATDNEKNIIYWNKGAEELYGLPANAVLGKKIKDIYDYKWENTDQNTVYRHSLKEKGSWRGESRHVFKKNNKEIFADSLVSVLRGTGGEEIGRLVLTRNITKRKEAENQLNTTVQRLNRSQEIAHLGSWELDLVKNQLTWSDEVYRIFGLNPQEFNATYDDFLKKVHPDDRQAVDAAYSGSIRDGRVAYEIVHRVIRPSGEIRIVHEKCEHMRDRAGKIVKSIGAIHDITERKKSEEKIEQLLKAVETAKEAIHIDTPDGVITYANQAMDELFGYEAGELIGKSCAILNAGAPADAQKITENITKALIEQNFWEGEIKNKRKDGTEFISYSRVSAYKDETGKIINVISTQHDITDEKKTREEKEQLLLENEQRSRYISALLAESAKEKELLRVIMENTDTHLAYLDARFNFIWVNPTYAQGAGYLTNELIGKNYFLLFPNAENQEVFEKARDTGEPVIFKGKPSTHQNQPEKGITFWDWTLIPIKDISGRVEGLVLSSVDVTEKHRRIEALRKSRAELKEYGARMEQMANDLKKFQLAVDNSSNAVIITDPQDKILYANPQTEKITGYPPAELLGKTSRHWCNYAEENDDPDFFAKIKETIKVAKKPFSGEITCLKKDGTKYLADTYIAPVLNESNDVLFFVRLFRDVTAEKEIDRAKTEFVSIASHQLRTPLATMSLSIEMLLNSLDAESIDEQKKQLREIYGDIEGMSKLIDALLNVSRIEMRTLIVAPEPTILKDIIASVFKEMLPQIHRKLLNVKINYDRSLPPINIDRNLLRIVLHNLLTNSVKYTPKNGSIACEVRKMESDALIKITDTGCGIPDEQQDKIFDKMFRAYNVIEQGAEGIGLGLYIVKSIVDQYGGHIWLDSEVDKGTTFYVTVPLKGMKKQTAVNSTSAN